MFHRFSFPICILALATTVSVVRAAPNIVVIISDDQGFRDVGYNDSEIDTPHLDALAKTGVRLDFNYTYTTCSPTRCALLTGRNPVRFGITGPIGGRSRQAVPKGTPTMASVLKRAGYFTAITGKWHLGLRPEVGPNGYGFDSAYGYLHGQIDPYTHIYKNGDATWHRDGKPIEEKGHATDLISDEAVRVIRSSRGKPFFLYVAYSVPHYPLAEPPEWTKRYDDRIDDPDRRLFAASLTHMDAGIGRIVKALDETKQRDNTIVVFTSDNGGQQSWNAPKSQYGGRFKPNKVLGDNRPLRGWKGDLYEGGIRVPALINWPAKLQPRRVATPVHVLDWLPTLAGYADARLPQHFDGRDIRAQLAGRATSVELSPKAGTFYWNTGRTAALRIGNLKLIQHRGRTKRYELFDLKADPNEKRDLAASHPRIAELKRALAAETTRQVKSAVR